MLLAALACTLTAQIAKEASYASPSGRRTFTVTPDDHSWTKPATYALTLDGVEVWHAELPFVLVDAAVADDGRVAGYACSGDHRGTSEELQVILLSPEGKVLAENKYAQEYGGSQHGWSVFFPYVEDVQIQPELGRFIVSIRGIEDVKEKDYSGIFYACWTYDLSTGTPLVQQRLHIAGSTNWLLGLRPVPATPLLVLSWARSIHSSEVAGRYDAVFQLIDEKAEIVWELEVPHDYELYDNWQGNLGLLNHLEAEPPILGTLPERFELRLIAGAQRVLFQVERSEDTWRVSELSRIAFPPPDLRPPWLRKAH